MRLRQDTEKGYWFRRYHLSREGTIGGWGVIIIDSKGFLGAFTDYGNYTYHWTSFAGDFRSFLRNLHSGYLMKKLGAEDYHKEDRDIREQIRGVIDQELKEGSLSKEQAATELALLKRSNLSHDIGVHEWYQETSLDVFDWLSTKEYSPQLQSFCTELWPRFVQALEDDRD